MPGELYNSKKADPPKKAYSGKQKKEEPLKERYRNPRTLGSPVEPVAPGEKPKGDTRQIGSQTVVKRPQEGFQE